MLAGDVESSTAARVWHYTRGNALYLRQLIADELAGGRFTQRAGVWIWDAHLKVSPSLAEPIDATIGRQPDPVLGVLDVLAVTDPVELAVLSAITPAAAIDAAEAAGVITVDTSSDPAVARTAHPLIGDVRRARPELCSCGTSVDESRPNSNHCTIRPIRSSRYAAPHCSSTPTSRPTQGY